MLKRLPSRNQKSKGFKVKHVLQICLLLGVCFWLVYQVKHSHDKKKEFDENGVKTSTRSKAESGIEVLKLGRKDLPREEATRREEKPEEEEEEEEEEKPERKSHEDRQEESESESESKLDEERGGEEEEENSKPEETEDGGGGDDEIDENDQERKDSDFVDEEKERDETVEDQVENENPLEDQESDHEAREEHYKADDASSEVTHDLPNKEIKINTEKSSDASNATSSEVSEVETFENKQLLETTQSSDQPEAGNITVPVSTESTNSSSLEGNNSTAEVNTEARNSSTELRIEASHNTSNESVVSDSAHDPRNLAVAEQRNDSGVDSEKNSTIVGGENRYEASKETESVESMASGNTSRPDETVRPEEGSGSSGSNVTRDEKPEDEEREAQEKPEEEEREAQEKPEEGSDEETRHDPIDASDTDIGQELTEARTDLDTLPELRSQGDDNEEAAAE